MLIGVISDTHGLLQPEANRALAGSRLIIPAGDIGDPKILDELLAIAPVIAVRGDIDRGTLPEFEWIHYEGLSIFVIHDVNQLFIDPAAHRIQVVISGHSHKPSIHTKEGR